jgi:hypothetical protein
VKIATIAFAPVAKGHTHPSLQALVGGIGKMFSDILREITVATLRRKERGSYRWSGPQNWITHNQSRVRKTPPRIPPILTDAIRLPSNASSFIDHGLSAKSPSSSGSLAGRYDRGRRDRVGSQLIAIGIIGIGDGSIDVGPAIDPDM